MKNATFAATVDTLTDFIHYHNLKPGFEDTRPDLIHLLAFIVFVMADFSLFRVIKRMKFV